MTAERTSQPTKIENILSEIIKEKIQTSLRFDNLIKTAKTKYKKDFYKKRLKDNNTEIARYSVMLQKVKDKNKS